MAISDQKIFSDSTVEVARVDNLLVVWWRSAPNAAAIEVFGPRLEALVARTDGLCLLGVTRGLSTIPDEPTRKLAAGFIRKLAPRLRAGAFAIEDEGFRAAAARAVVTGLLAIAPLPLTVRIFGSVDDATGWLAPQLGIHGDDMRASVVSAVRALVT